MSWQAADRESGQIRKVLGMTKAKQIENKVRRSWKNCLRRLILVLPGLLMGAELYSVNAGRIMGDPMSMPFGYGAAVVLSGSMEPVYSAGDLLIVKKADRLKTGDIVVYQMKRNLVVHRIVDIRGDLVITQGDANNAPDEPFERKPIKGISVVCIPRVGIWFCILKTHVGRISVFACIAFLIGESFRTQCGRDTEKLKEEIRQREKKQGGGT